MTARLFIAAAHKSSGKTTLSLGLCAALRQQGYRVQPFKKGPDYIDPLWLSQAAGRLCFNLDFYTMQHQEIIDKFLHHSRDADITLIEGNKGLYDGLDLHGNNSNAALARLLQTPVILVIDCRGITRGVVPLLLGYQQFEPETPIAGVILNQVGGARHASKLQQAIDYYTDLPVVGRVEKNPALLLSERHLGLMPCNESPAAAQQIQAIAAVVAEQVDLAACHRLAQQAPAFNTVQKQAVVVKTDVRIGIVQDAAFGFYYPDDLQALTRNGAKLITINALQDAHLPEIDGLFIGGGFPETQMPTLAANKNLRLAIKQAVENGLPVYAECGGLMYLGRQICWHGHCYPMTGALAFDTVMAEKPQGRGYVQLKETGAGLWPLRDAQGQLGHFPAHEFHYSRIENLSPALNHFAYQVERGYGITGQHDGLVYKNTLACYAHLRDVANNPWTQRFVAFVRQHRLS
jgi:cobyrinic acid a,c-diamide synthase